MFEYFDIQEYFPYPFPTNTYGSMIYDTWAFLEKTPTLIFLLAHKEKLLVWSL